VEKGVYGLIRSRLLMFLCEAGEAKEGVALLRLLLGAVVYEDVCG